MSDQPIISGGSSVWSGQLIVPSTAERSLYLCADGGEIIVRIYFDGSIEINPRYTVDQAAKAFWDAVRKLAPGAVP